MVIAISIQFGQINADRRYEANLGDTVLILVISDVAEELHVHGYDLFLELIPGAEVDLEFVADLPGVWEVELEGAHRLLFELAVS